MPRKIVNLDGLVKEFGDAGWTKSIIYKMVRAHENPLPHKKNGKRLEFDIERVYRWWDGLPGEDRT